MIRINLLEARPKSTERLDALLSPGGSSTFTSRREGLLGVLFLVLTVAILGVLAYRFISDDEAEGEPEQATAVEPARPAPEPAPVAEPPSEEPEPAASEPEAAPKPAPATPAEAEPTEPKPEPVAAAPKPASAPPPPTPSAPPAQPAASSSGNVGGERRALTAVRVTPLADRVDIFLEMSDAPTVSGFHVEDPPRVVFDIPGARLQVAHSLRNQAIDSPLVHRLRIAQYTFDPPLVRMVLEVGSFPSTEVSASAAGLSIRVTPAQ